MSLLTIAAFSLVAMVAIATPGPTVLLALANGSRFGIRRAVYGMLGAVASGVRTPELPAKPLLGKLI